MNDQTDGRDPPIARLGRRSFASGAAALALLPAAASAAPTLRRVSLAWPAVAADVAVLAATRQGFLANHGLAVDLVPVADTADLAAVLHDGRADACVGPALQLLVPLNQGLDARITTGISGGGLRLLVTRRSGLRRIEDMSRKRVGVARLDGVARLFFSIMMRRKGTNPYKEVTWVAVEPARMGDALRDGTVDAIAAADAEAFFLREQMHLVEIASNASGSYRERTTNVLAVSGKLLARDRDAVRGLTAALLEAARWVAANADQAAALMAPLAPMLDVLDCARMLGEETPGVHPHGAALEEDIAADADELRLLGPLPYELNAARFAHAVCLDALRG